MHISFIYLILIQLCVIFKILQIAFLNFKSHFLKMTQFHTSYFCELAESYFQS